MRCPKCGFDNPAGMRFCGQCTNPLAMVCPSCHFENPPGFKFCGQCTTALGTDSAKPRWSNPAATSETDNSAAIDGERKTVTAFFADIKGSMELMEDLDPEEARAIVDPALKLMIGAIQHYDGFVVQSTGDGIFALFGAPVGHEDHPQLSLYAAVRIHEEIRRYDDRLRGRGQAPLLVRIGVNTGEVVVRSIQTSAGHAEYTPIGHSTSLAARLQALAAPGSTVISSSTQKFVEGYFQLRSLGPTTLKGVSEPIEVFEVIGLGPLRTRFQAAARRGLTRFIGRDPELAQMRQALELARGGHGQIVAAIGEAGVGKSRLFFEFRAIAEAGSLVLEAYSVSHGKASAYLPVIELLLGYFDITAEDDERRRREKFAGKVLMLDRALEDTLPYIFTLFGVHEARDPLGQMDPQVRRKRTPEAIKRILVRESLNQPVIVVFEDLHWIDGETQAFLNVIVDAIANARILLLVNYRPEYRHEWSSRTYYTQLRLDPFSRERASEMLCATLGKEVELQPLRQLIAERTEGNPFFMEEMVQTLFEEGVVVRNGTVRLARSLAEIRVPPTVQAVLAARIDRLPIEEKELLQILAVIGREFGIQLIRQVAECSEPELERMLLSLQSAEFIYEQPAFPDPEYSFKHALTQEVAYNSVLVERRKRLHERAAVAMESLSTSRVEPNLPELARHYQRSGNTAKAIEYLKRAGQQALVRSGYAQAIELFTSALEFVNTLPATPELMQQELAVQLGLGSALSAAKGIASPETGRAFDRANDLCREFGTSSQIFAVLVGINSFYNGRGELRRAHELARQLLAMAESQPDRSLLVAAHWSMALNLCFMGEFATARNHVESALSFYDPAHIEELQTVNPLAGDLRPSLLMLAALIVCFLGYPDQARARCEEAVTLARTLSLPFRLVIGLGFSAVVRVVRREGEPALGQADEAIRLATEHGFQEFLARVLTIRGMVLVELNRNDEGICQLRDGIIALRASGTEAQQPAGLAFLAAAYLKLGRIAEGLNAVAEGLTLSKKTGECWYDAELFRIKGELLVQQTGQNAAEQAEASFSQALEIARRQQAKWWELRTVVSLARLMTQQGRRNEARSMLAEIYNWFTEGFDTADLKDAKGLLDDLSR
ncbi:MAG: AAA family ATPase [Deltaproteobacteria bacterium]|nr:AAA family ATPase [Deltaproteobacteria bacterium]